MMFWLGAPEPVWLSRTALPLFVSHRRLRKHKRLPRALGRWALDSGSFSELSMHGRFETPPREYVAAVQRYRDLIGSLEWAAIQDWMCEPFMLAKTGLTVAEHQERTCRSFEELSDLAPDVPWVPVLQGYDRDEYRRHAELYDQRGIKLKDRLVGLGSICRRQAILAGVTIARTLAYETGAKLHGFGVKVRGLSKLAHVIESADSMAWSYRARRSKPLTGHTHKSCANCMEFALTWRARTLANLPPQYELPFERETT